MFINIFDSHVHSDNSSDACHSMTFLCENAVKRGVSGFCVTDHCEMRDFNQNQYAQRVAQSVFEARKSKVIFNGRLAVMSGIELSDLLFDPALTQTVIDKYQFDMVMASQHNMDDGTDFYFTDFTKWSGKQIYQALDNYFDYLLRVVQSGMFDTLAHLTYPLRYISGRCKRPVDLSAFDGIIDEILKGVVRSGKAIEINTSGLWQELEDTMPPYSYVKRYQELGGEYITLGSDSHSADTLGRGIDIAMQMLLDAGFRYFTFYKERQPLQLKLI